MFTVNSKGRSTFPPCETREERMGAYALLALNVAIAVVALAVTDPARTLWLLVAYVIAVVWIFGLPLIAWPIGLAVVAGLAVAFGAEGPVMSEAFYDGAVTGACIVGGCWAIAALKHWDARAAHNNDTGTAD